ncbi:MAG TPA: HAD hydrolase-like protein [Actinophytocola sp.]|uniref:HAD family hydrolase n=1 Tax=Actinophytocola sp. TaxID=1872138 RepID=UPI002DDD5C02|nr:HAD hydrolase-like protein [Actinophytocola sp.]HEV2783311.1 HAD hydrolase-like protein [Actinophytocola sp.]
MILVLWDIDLTLVDYSGIGRAWYGQALSNVLGVPMRGVPAFPGRTERAITTELLTEHGVTADEETVQKMFAELIRIAEAARPELTTLGRALPGAPEVLADLAARPGVVQSLVTGNLPEVAGLKLEPFGLDRHVDLEVGGYGSLSLDRHDLVSDAMTQAGAKYGTSFAPWSTVVIGDTPNDIRAGLHHGTITVGVATGRHTEEELRASGAHAVLPSLADTRATLEAVLG